MAPSKSYVYVILADDGEIISAHTTEESARSELEKFEGDEGDVKKVELISAPKAATSKAKPKNSTAADKTRTTAAHDNSEKLDIPTANDPSALAGQTIVFSGELSSMKRKEAQALAQAAGAKILGSISKNCTLVVLGKDAGPKKLEQIEKLAIETTDEQGFFDMIKGDGPAGSKRAADDDDDDDDDEEDEDEDEVDEKPAPKKKRAKTSK